MVRRRWSARHGLSLAAVVALIAGCAEDRVDARSPSAASSTTFEAPGVELPTVTPTTAATTTSTPETISRAAGTWVRLTAPPKPGPVFPGPGAEREIWLGPSGSEDVPETLARIGPGDAVFLSGDLVVVDDRAHQTGWRLYDRHTGEEVTNPLRHLRVEGATEDRILVTEKDVLPGDHCVYYRRYLVRMDDLGGPRQPVPCTGEQLMLVGGELVAVGGPPEGTAFGETVHLSVGRLVADGTAWEYASGPPIASQGVRYDEVPTMPMTYDGDRLLTMDRTNRFVEVTPDGAIVPLTAPPPFPGTTPVKSGPPDVFLIEGGVHLVQGGDDAFVWRPGWTEWRDLELEALTGPGACVWTAQPISGGGFAIQTIEPDSQRIDNWRFEPTT